MPRALFRAASFFFPGAILYQPQRCPRRARPFSTARDSGPLSIEVSATGGAAVLGDELLDDVEPDGQDDVGHGKRLFDRQRLHPPSQLLRELSRLSHVGLRHDHALGTRGEIVATLDHSRLHREIPFRSRRLGEPSTALAVGTGRVDFCQRRAKSSPMRLPIVPPGALSV
jgi:hypothetical protein